MRKIMKDNSDSDDEDTDTDECPMLEEFDDSDDGDETSTPLHKQL